MIDNLAIGITHLLLVIAIIRLLSRGDLDREPKSGPALEAPPSAVAPLENTPVAPPSTSRVGVARLTGLGRGNRRV